MKTSAILLFLSSFLLSSTVLAHPDEHDHFDLYARDLDARDADLDFQEQSLYRRGVLDAREEIFETLRIEARSTCPKTKDGKHVYKKRAGSGCICFKCGHTKTINIC